LVNGFDWSEGDDYYGEEDIKPAVAVLTDELMDKTTFYAFVRSLGKVEACLPISI